MTIEHKQSPGPWFIENDSVLRCIDEEFTICSGPIVRGDLTDADMQAGTSYVASTHTNYFDAVLIAAAPDLLDAARAGMEYCYAISDPSVKHDRLVELFQNWMDIQSKALERIGE